MADFDADITSAYEIADWADEGSEAIPSRLNAKAGLPHRYVRIAFGSCIFIKASVAGVVGPADTTLGGRLFTKWFVECPHDTPPVVGSPSGYSSIVIFTPEFLGAYLFGFRRPEGGGVFIHFVVEMA